MTGSEIGNKKFILFTIRALSGMLLAAGLVAGINISVDGSQKLNTTLYYQMAQLTLSGETVANPENYDERAYQVLLVASMDHIPETVVVGSSRGMYLGKEITGYVDIYNNCVSGGIIDDYYAILGLYEGKFDTVPSRVIMEVSPWCFYGNITERRWQEVKPYSDASKQMYRIVNGKEIVCDNDAEVESPYLSLAYFQYNYSMIDEDGISAFIKPLARVSTDPAEAAELPDGTIRYPAEQENPSVERLKEVQSVTGAITYREVDCMEYIDTGKQADFENLIHWLKEQGTDVMIYMEPFSATQCRLSFDENMNPAITLVEKYLHTFGKRENILVLGGFDARDFGLTDDDFINTLHLGREGVRNVWRSGCSSSASP